MKLTSREVRVGAVSAVVALGCYELVRQRFLAMMRRRWYCEAYGVREKGGWWMRNKWLREFTRWSTSDRSVDHLANVKMAEAKPQKKLENLPEHVICEMLSRHEAFFGVKGHGQVRCARVCVMGLGGVGSHLTMMLARAGVAFLRIVDFDHVSLSSLNRHSVATLADVGTPKSTTVRDAIASIAPFVTVDARNVMFTAETSEEMLEGKFDLVIDCIDDVETKAVLLEACVRLKLRCISAMGAGAKADPTRLCVSPLADAVHDPLAAKLRWKLRSRGVDYGGAELDIPPPMTDPAEEAVPRSETAAELITCVYSHERPRCTLLPLTQEQISQGAKNYGAVDVDHFRVRVLPVLGASPALMGQAMAAVALCQLASSPICPVAREPLSRKLKERMISALRKREARREFGPKAEPQQCGWVEVNYEDLEYVVAEVWRGRCSVTRRKLERKPLALTRWWTSRRRFIPVQGEPPESCANATPVEDVTETVIAEELILVSPPLADRLDQAFDAAALQYAPERPSPEVLRKAAAAALGGFSFVDAIDERIGHMRNVSGGDPWR